MNGKRKRVSKDPETRREELLQTAAALFAEKGVAATNVGDITDAANVARGTFYLYFPSKDDVVAELWRRYVSGFLATTDGGHEGRADEAIGKEGILHFLQRLTRHALDHAHLHRLVYGTADAAAIALCKQSDEVILAKLRCMIGAYFSGSGRQDRDADLAASLIFHGLDGALHRAIMAGTLIDQGAFIQEVSGLAEGVLDRC